MGNLYDALTDIEDAKEAYELRAPWVVHSSFTKAAVRPMEQQLLDMAFVAERRMRETSERQHAQRDAERALELAALRLEMDALRAERDTARAERDEIELDAQLAIGERDQEISMLRQRLRLPVFVMN